MPMELSEPHPENEALEPGGPEDQPSADPPGPEAGPEDEEKKEVACWEAPLGIEAGGPRGHPYERLGRMGLSWGR